VIQKGRRERRGCTFDDVNFAASRPWTCLTLHPKGGPGGTTGGHVCQVEDEYRLVIRILRLISKITTARVTRALERLDLVILVSLVQL